MCNREGTLDPMADLDRPELRKSVSQLGFFALAFGSMIGVGWVTALGGWLGSAGPVGAILAFAAGSALILVIGLCYAELCSMLPVAGGEVAYSYRAYGPSKSYAIGAFLAFGYLAVCVFEAISVTKVVGYLVPGGLAYWPIYSVAGQTVHATELAFALAATGALTWVSYRGIEAAAKLQALLVLLFGLATLAFIGTGIIGGSFDNLPPLLGQTAEGGANGWGTALAGMGAVFVTVPFWFVGFDTIPQVSEEAAVAVSPRALARLIVVSIVGAAAFYILVILAVGMSGPWTELLGEDLVAAVAFEQAFDSPLLANLVLLAAALGLFTSWNGFFLAGSRVLFALGRGHMAPPSLGHAHPAYGTPSNAIVFGGLFTAAGACLGTGALGVFINVGSFCMSLAFFGVTFSMMKLRKSAPDMKRPFRLPGGRLLPSIAAIGAGGILLAMVIPGSPAALKPLEWVVLGIVIALVFVGWQLGASTRRVTSEKERARLVLGEFADD